MDIFAPILLFTYKRLDTLKLTIEALKLNKFSSESDLYIFSDAPKSKKDESIINEVRIFLKSITGFKSITIEYSSINKGLANSIIDGVTKILNEHDNVIVLEDDLITSTNFLSFMNSCLDFYKNKNNVFSISGFTFDFDNDCNEMYDDIILNRGWSWGWATWKNRWEKVDWEVNDYNSFKYNLKERRAFSKGGSDLNKMLDKQMSGKLDSWAIRWFYCQYKINGLTVYPLISKVCNIGFDGNATHTKGSNKRYLSKLDKNEFYTFYLTDKIEVNPHYQKQFNFKMGIISRIISKLESLLLILKKDNVFN